MLNDRTSGSELAAASTVSRSVAERLAGRTLLVDMRICQLWRERGIPRYVQSLLAKIATQAPELKFMFLYSRQNPNPLRHDELMDLGPVIFDDPGDSHRDLGVIDAFLVSTFFLPPPPQHIVEYLLPPFLLRDRPKIFGIVYDFIPKLFPEIYLPGETEVRNYALCVEAMRRCAHLFAISDTTRRDGINLLGLDPERITNVYGSIDEDHWETLLQGTPAPIPHTTEAYPFGSLVNDRYYLYVSGDDWRKNMDGLIRGHALARSQSDTRPFPPLVIACSMHPSRVDHFYELGRMAGLRPRRDLFLTGELSDEDLVRLIRGALTTVYASVYEGLGLPILESYACGTPVVGSNCSSVSELVHPECSFDPQSDADIARALLRIKDDAAVRQASREFGFAIRRRINWDNTTSLVLERIATALEQRDQRQPRQQAHPVAVFSALPPAETGVARFTRDTLRTAPWRTHLFTRFDSSNALVSANVDLVAAPVKEHSRPNGHTGASAFASETFDLMSTGVEYAKRVYVLGNSVHHLDTLSAAIRFGREANADSYLYLHEANNAGLWLCYCDLNFTELKALFAAHYPTLRTEILAATGMDHLFQMRCYGVRPIVELTGIRRLIVNSEQCRRLVMEDLGSDSPVVIDVAFHPFLDTEASVARGIVSRPQADLVVGHFGTVGPHKRIALLGEACKKLAKSMNVSLVLAGFDVRQSMAEHRMPVYDFHQLIDSPPLDELLRWMDSVDVAVQLRHPYFGESSGCVNQLLSLNQRLIVSRGAVDPILRSHVTEVSSSATADDLARTLLEVAATPRRQSAAELVDRYSVAAYQERLAGILAL